MLENKILVYTKKLKKERKKSLQRNLVMKQYEELEKIF